MSDISINNPFLPILGKFGKLIKEEETSEAWYQLYEKNVLYMKNKLGVKRTMKAVDVTIEVVKRSAMVNKLPLIFLSDGRNTEEIDPEVGIHWTNESKDFIRNTIAIYKKGKMLNSFIDFMLIIAKGIPWIDISMVFTANIDKAVEAALKALDKETSTEIYSKLKAKKKKEDFKTDIQILWAMSKGGVKSTWQEINDQIDADITWEAVRQRFNSKIYPVVKTNNSAMMFGYVRDMIFNGIELPIEFIDYVSQEVLKENLKGEPQ